MNARVGLASGVALLVVQVAPGAGTAFADPQGSARLHMGAGVRRGTTEYDERLFDMGLRSELLFGAPGDEHARAGPAFELRTADYDTVEVAGGGTLLLPIARGYPLLLSALVGFAERVHIPSSPIFVGTLAWGYRSYNFHSFYSLGLQLYITTRVDLREEHGWEVTAGVEIDLEALVVIPVGFFKMLASRGDPYEE